MASNILSDLLFLAFTLAFLIAATDMLEKGTLGSIVYLGVIASLSTFQRYAGLALIMTGAVLVLFVSEDPSERNYFCRVVWLFIRPAHSPVGVVP